jgi:hypothetical protein
MGSFGTKSMNTYHQRAVAPRLEVAPTNIRVKVIDVHPWLALRADERGEEDFSQWRKTSQVKVAELHQTFRITCSMLAPTKVRVTSLPRPFTVAGDVKKLFRFSLPN